MTKFREVLENCHLGDLGFSSSCFTWSNRRLGNSFTKERLDRAMSNPEWCSLFPKVSVLVLAIRTSDHSPLAISFKEDVYERMYHRRGFKFEAWWAKDVECPNIIKSAWDEDILINASISNVQDRLSAWSDRVEECIRFVTPRVSEDMKNWLLQQFTEDEVRRALFQMHPLKFPRPYGFPAVFYQKN
ncbi:uncharacterized protein LOC133871632 [Alnus glutinosa]|uniref:uncharacterized protein LOC133871632 n=1 Tax=Alnus glutinosa TaxID=3517 RepID=UPI002D77D292|nr:uncharacterized protein LOC133871632 [Alnus glutinosa]